MLVCIDSIIRDVFAFIADDTCKGRNAEDSGGWEGDEKDVTRAHSAAPVVAK